MHHQWGTMKQCRACHRKLPFGSFHRSKAAPDGRQYTCKACQVERHRRERRARGAMIRIPIDRTAQRPGHKVCARCRTEKPLEEFYRLRSSADGRQVWCRDCHRAAFERKRREVGILPAAEWRLLRRTRAVRPERRCVSCSKIKPRSDFHRNASSLGGTTSICRACRREYDRAQHAALRADPKRLEQYRAARRAWYRRTKQNDKPRSIVRRMVYLAIKAGLLTRQPCTECGNPQSEAHHDDYTKPLDVRWLCRAHHRAVDKGT